MKRCREKFCAFRVLGGSAPGGFFVALCLLGLLGLVGLVCLTACELPFFAEPPVLVMTYNVHNLFDDVCDGSEYPEFVPEEGGWDTAAFHARLDDIGRVIRGTRGTYGNGPDVVVLAEVENLHVVEELRDRVLGRRRYSVAVASAVEGNAIQIGLLSRFPLEDIRLHGFEPLEDKQVRPVMEAVVRLDNDKRSRLHIFACHWPSKLGGEEATEVLRLQAAGVVARRVYQLGQEAPNDLVLVCGDLNQTLPQEIDSCGYMTNEEIAAMPARSLMAACDVPPDLEAACDWATLEGLYSENLRPLYVSHNMRLAASQNAVFFSPWRMTEDAGSYVYQDDWEQIDHFLLGRGLCGQSYYPADFWVEKRDWMLTARGEPRPYQPGRHSGLSDHLPIVLELRPATENSR